MLSTDTEECYYCMQVQYCRLGHAALAVKRQPTCTAGFACILLQAFSDSDCYCTKEKLHGDSHFAKVSRTRLK